jgi:hypothetical protein
MIKDKTKQGTTGKETTVDSFIIDSPNPKRAAYLFGAILAADKGVQSRVLRCARGFKVVADDGKVVTFSRSNFPCAEEGSES